MGVDTKIWAIFRTEKVKDLISYLDGICQNKPEIVSRSYDDWLSAGNKQILKYKFILSPEEDSHFWLIYIPLLKKSETYVKVIANATIRTHWEFISDEDPIEEKRILGELAKSVYDLVKNFERFDGAVFLGNDDYDDPDNINNKYYDNIFKEYKNHGWYK
jgi:hypothetical protein